MLLSSVTFVRLPRVAAPTGRVCFDIASPQLFSPSSAVPANADSATSFVRSSSVLYTPCPTARRLSHTALLGVVR